MHTPPTQRLVAVILDSSAEKQGEGEPQLHTGITSQTVTEALTGLSTHPSRHVQPRCLSEPGQAEVTTWLPQQGWLSFPDVKKRLWRVS